MDAKSATRLFGLLLLGVSVPAQAKQIAFVGCPVVRDVAEPDRPCWLAERDGQLYYLGQQSDTIPPITFYPPQLKHKVLVEGELADDGSTACGGLAFKKVSVSPLPELAPECDTILPQAGIVPPKARKLSPPFSTGQKLAIPVEGAPNRSYRMPQFPPPKPPYKSRTFRLSFAFGDDFFHLMEGLMISQAVGYFEAIDAGNVVLEIHRDRVTLDDGTVMEEGPEVARRRAERTVSVLTEWGVPRDRVVTQVAEEAGAGGRYLIITVSP